MDNFEIQDAHRLLEQAGDLDQVNNNIRAAKENISSCCDQISGAWQSDTVDKDSYLKTIRDNIQKLDTLNSAIKSLGASLRDFATQAINTANNG